MKTIDQIKEELRVLVKDKTKINELGNSYCKPNAEITRLKLIIRYLETNPRKEFIVAERDGLVAKLNLINERYDEWYDTNKTYLQFIGVNKIQAPSHYRKINEVDGLRKQLFNLNYILDEE